MSNGIDPQKLNKFLDENATDKVKKAIANKNAGQILSSLSQEDRKKFEQLLKDKAARDKLLSSPEVKKLLDMLSGGR